MDTRQAPTLDEYTMVLAGALPLSMHPAPRQVGVIGFGSGLTANTLLGDDRVQSMDVVEIEPFMVKAARNFGSRVERVYSDPRAHIVIDDAKAYFSGSTQRYDVIVSEPSNPWVSGVATLFTEEFYDFVPAHLADDGIFVQWLQLYEISPDLVASVLKAMLPRFADVQAYISNQSDLILVATRSGKVPAPGEPTAHAPRLQAELDRLSMATAGQLRQFFLMDRTGLAAVARTSGVPANSDFFPLVQLDAPAARFAQADATRVAALASAPWPLLEVAGGYQPPPATADIGEQSIAVHREPPLRASRAIREALLGKDLKWPSRIEKGLDSAFELLLGARQCTPSAINPWLNASATIAANTIPYLPSADLHGVWLDPAWVAPCWRTEPHVAKALALHGAMAARDWAAVAQIGEEIVGDVEFSGAPAFRTYAAGAVELALLALGDARGLVAFDKRYGQEMLAEHTFERRWMQAAAAIAHDAHAPAAHQGGANP